MNYLQELFAYTFIFLVVVVGIIIGLCNTDADTLGEEKSDEEDTQRR